MYEEKCEQQNMATYPFFLKKLALIEKLAKKQKQKQRANSTTYITKCSGCTYEKFYRLGNIIWSNNVKHSIEQHQSYPSHYFIMVIINTCLIDNRIINPPVQIPPEKISSFRYIPLHYNKLLIIDALMQQGSYPRYENNDRYIYSEHSGVLILNNHVIDNIIVFTESSRIDPKDGDIYLPTNTELLAEHEYIFHTHPNATVYGGRIADGIIYEFPSSNDILNFVKYYNSGKVLASIVIVPEGIYLIRPIRFVDKLPLSLALYEKLFSFILELEQTAIRDLMEVTELTDADRFHQYVGYNFTYIEAFNKFIRHANLFIEYYPREKKNGEWCLRQINLPFVDK